MICTVSKEMKFFDIELPVAKEWKLYKHCFPLNWKQSFEVYIEMLTSLIHESWENVMKTYDTINYLIMKSFLQFRLKKRFILLEWHIYTEGDTERKNLHLLAHSPNNCTAWS